MNIFHVDVFSKKPFSGNGLTVVFPEDELSEELMQKIACEYKQFETIFIYYQSENLYSARIFTVEEELDFAGHPILGAAAVIHEEFFKGEIDKTITIKLNEKSVVINSKKQDNYFEVVMNQGVPEWGKLVDKEWQIKYCKALNLNEYDLCKEYPMEVVSTGLPYLLVPVKSGLSNSKICCSNFEDMLSRNDAKFVYVFDINAMEGRTWDNLGTIEDVATGSAAGPMGAYLYKYKCFKENQIINIHQGKYLGRESILKVSYSEHVGEILVSGDVTILSKGELMI